MNYSSISDFGANVVSEIDNPLTYCLSTELNNGFLHGSSSDTLGPNSQKCQMFLSEYCAQKWDGFCEAASHNTATSYPNMGYISGCTVPQEINGRRITQGEILIHNTAARKYLQRMHGGHEVYEPFDPNVASSPVISYYIPGRCTLTGRHVATYAVDPSTIDGDVVMDKLLMTPAIAPMILVNIYNTMKNSGELVKLRGTKLGHFYTVIPYFKDRGGLDG